MPLLITGFMLVFAALLGWGIGADTGWLRYQTDSIPRLAAVMVLAPALAAWAAAEFVALVSPRRLFDRRRRTRIVRFVLGAFAGAMSAIAGAALLPLADGFLPDAAIFGAASALLVSACILACGRIRPGHCIHCGYDLRQSPAPGQPGAGRCPECGAEIVERAESPRVGPAPASQVP